MALNPRCYALSEISYLVANITKKNYNDTKKELEQVKYMYRTVISEFLQHIC